MSLRLKYQNLKTSGCKYIGIRKFKFDGKNFYINRAHWVFCDSELKSSNISNFNTITLKSIRINRYTEWLNPILLSVCFIYPMSGRYSTNRDRKGWPGSEIQMYYGCPCQSNRWMIFLVFPLSMMKVISNSFFTRARQDFKNSFR